MREDTQEGQPGCTRFQSGVARLGLGLSIKKSMVSKQQR
jgi:hypothetical protein